MYFSSSSTITEERTPSKFLRFPPTMAARAVNHSAMRVFENVNN